jgi:hypothetical protein
VIATSRTNPGGSLFTPLIESLGTPDVTGWLPPASHFNMPLGTQIVWLLLLAAPVATIAWTVTHEEVFREPRDFCVERSQHARNLLCRKFFYLFTCEYCFSHYVAAFFVAIAGFHLLLPGWRGYLMAWFSVVWVANVYMNLYSHIRLDIKKERVEIKAVEEQVNKPDKPSPKLERPAA